MSQAEHSHADRCQRLGLHRPGHFEFDPRVQEQYRARARRDGFVCGVFAKKYKLRDEFMFADYSTRELKERDHAGTGPGDASRRQRRFRTGQRLARDLGRQIDATSTGQNPFAVVLSCIDSRVPVELILDQGIGDVFSVRVAGNVVGTKTMASIEYAVGGQRRQTGSGPRAHPLRRRHSPASISWARGATSPRKPAAPTSDRSSRRSAVASRRTSAGPPNSFRRKRNRSLSMRSPSGM